MPKAMYSTGPRPGARPKPTQEPKDRPVATNRRARFDYAILETVEAGLVLTGTEIKSVRQGKVDLRDAYARPLRQELWLENAHIAQYTEGNAQNHEPKRARKLLLHRRQIDNLSAQISKKGLTVVPLRMYIKGRVAKVLLGLAKGKRSYEKRDALIERAVERETRREIKNMYR